MYTFGVGSPKDAAVPFCVGHDDDASGSLLSLSRASGAHVLQKASTLQQSCVIESTIFYLSCGHYIDVLIDIFPGHGPRGRVIQETKGMCEGCDRKAEIEAYSNKGKGKKKQV